MKHFFWFYSFSSTAVLIISFSFMVLTEFHDYLCVKFFGNIQNNLYVCFLTILTTFCFNFSERNMYLLSKNLKHLDQHNLKIFFQTKMLFQGKTATFYDLLTNIALKCFPYQIIILVEDKLEHFQRKVYLETSIKDFFC